MSERASKAKDPRFPEDAIQFPVKPSPLVSADASLRAGLSELAALARQAFEEKHRKSCMALTRAMLKIDPENKDAQVMQSWIQSDLQQDIKSAFALIRDARSRDDLATYKRAERMLHNILDIDASNEDAAILLSRVDWALGNAATVPSEPAAPPAVRHAVQLPAKPPIPSDPVESFEPEVRQPDRHRLGPAILIVCLVLLGITAVVLFTGTREWLGLFGVGAGRNASIGTLEVAVDEGVRVFVDGQDAGAAPIVGLTLTPGIHQLRYEFDGADVGKEEVTVTKDQVATNSMHAFLGRLELVVVPSDTLMRIDDRPAVPVPPYLDVKPGSHRLAFAAKGYKPQTVSVSVAAGGRRNVNAALIPAIPPAAKPASKPPTPAESQPPSRPASSSPGPAGDLPVDRGNVQGPNGILAVASSLPVEIYMDSNRIGSTPATLELPPGNHTLEYRYRDLRKTVVHVIGSNQTTRATITFEVTAQIDSAPKADVFLDGIPLRSLGSTPLDGVRLAIGSVLVFRNPDFPEKRHVVTEKDTVIHVVFP